MNTSGPKILVTGGAGYIGSHTCKALAQAGYQPVVFDNLSTGHAHAVKWGPMVEGDLADTALLAETLRAHKPIAVVHFAALSLVAESVRDPGLYYQNNVAGSISLLNAMVAEGCRNIVFSSTAATYGAPETQPISEETETNPLNPYGRTKLMIEAILKDFEKAYGITHVALRYFNACGSDPDGEIGEEHDPETHLIPNLLKAIKGEKDHFELYGTDYDTKDGTCLRDYIHVCDLAAGHIKALEYLHKGGVSTTINLGSGSAYSVQEIIEAAKRVTDLPLTVKVCERRASDPPVLKADISKSGEILDFKAQQSDLDTVISNAWAFMNKPRR